MLELTGPRVSVDRNGTADRGGGQLVLKQGNLLVRTRSMERLLGAASAIDHIQLVDLQRLHARVCFADGQVWNVYSERGEDLTPFFRQVEAAVGRPDVLRDPPRISEIVRAAATPARTRTALLTALALIAYLPLRWLGGMARPVGVVLAVLALAALIVAASAFVRRHDDGPALLARVQPLVSWPWLAAAVVALIAGSMGYFEASARAALADEQARAQAEAAQRAKEAAAREKAAAEQRAKEAAAIAAQLVDTVRKARFRDAKALYDRLVELAPQHEAIARVRQDLERGLAQLDERERVRGIARGIAQARAIAKDPLACETAKRVADAHALLRNARPSDADYEAARRAVAELERCRKRVRARFAQSAEEGRHRERLMAAAQIQSEVRRLGYPATVKVAGRNGDVLHIEAPQLDAEAARRILELRAKDGAAFEAARTEEGFARIELRGDKFKRDVRLKPRPAGALVTPVLEKFGLENELALAEPTP